MVLGVKQISDTFTSKFEAFVHVAVFQERIDITVTWEKYLRTHSLGVYREPSGGKRIEQVVDEKEKWDK